MSEDRLKIAVFIDFDNIEIGVKKTLNRHFDVGHVLEAIKERGEVVTKIAYGDWKHAADYSRALTQHAVHMVQRNLTPGGDKNGADITLALDALEMAFTRSHINAFVIVGGDSDFIALVEKLKQYDKTVFVVGGRSFTSSILQKNCHEFIAYENLIGIQPAVRKAAGKAPAPSTAQLRDALPPLRRALEVLSDREVSPQLGLLKSTLLQLDSTFSERNYGAHSFREFIQKMANAGFVNLKQVDRSLLVELKEAESVPPPAAHHHEIEERPSFLYSKNTARPSPAELTASTAGEPGSPATGESAPPPPKDDAMTPPQGTAAVAAVRKILEQLGARPHWPMYLRSFKHFLRSADPTFDERRFGLSSIHDLARQAQREGLLRIERNRQGILRIYAGEQFPHAVPTRPPLDVEEPVPVEAQAPGPEEAPVAGITPVAEPTEAAPGVPPEGPPEETTSGQPEIPLGGKPKRRRALKASVPARARRTPARKPRTSRKATKTETPVPDA